jgi:hypothetical protein
MDLRDFLCASLGSRTAQLHDSLGSRRAHVQRLVSVFKMATVLEMCNTEEQRYVVGLFMDKRTQCKGYSKRNISCLRLEVFVA